jgi:hypothetical protein
MYGEVVEAVVAIAEGVKEPELMQNIAFLMNVLVREGEVERVAPLVTKVAGWLAVATERQFGYANAIANIGSLFLQIAIRAEGFPEEFVVVALQAFPPSDALETPAMAAAIVEIAGRGPGERILLEITLAVARYIVSENGKVPQELHEGLVGIFRTLCQKNRALVTKIRKTYQNQRAKIRSIDRVLAQ